MICDKLNIIVNPWLGDTYFCTLYQLRLVKDDIRCSTCELSKHHEKTNSVSIEQTGGQADRTGLTPLKTRFLSEYQPTIVKWTRRNEHAIRAARTNYLWKGKSTAQCVASRNALSTKIQTSQMKHSGGIDLATLDDITQWGFGCEFPLRDPQLALEITRDAFEYLNQGNIREATQTLLQIYNVGISRASTILGLSDQERLCIYDSRVGNALNDLIYHGEKIVLSPGSRNRDREYDIVFRPDIWAEYYEKLIWTVDVMKEYLNGKGCTYRLADVEMALFMMGQ
jgi:hypothetical protein